MYTYLMNNFWITLAHAGEDHEVVTEGIWHSLTSEWYVLLLIVLNISLVLVMAVYFLSKKSTSATTVAIEFVLLISAILTFEKLPYYATLAIVVGFGLSFFTVWNGLRKT